MAEASGLCATARGCRHYPTALNQPEERVSFELLHADGTARRGRLTTPHGPIETPVFMPVGTQGSVKSLTSSQLASLGPAITDDAQLVEALGKPVYAVEGAADNIKITAKGDLALAAAILKSRPEPKAARPIHPFADEEMWK